MIIIIIIITIIIIIFIIIIIIINSPSPITTNININIICPYTSRVLRRNTTLCMNKTHHIPQEILII
jgi:hypothetical protein